MVGQFPSIQVLASDSDQAGWVGTEKLAYQMDGAHLLERTSPSATESFIYSSGRLSAVNGSSIAYLGGGELSGALGETYSFDPRGQLLSVGTMAFGYDAEGLLATYEEGESETTIARINKLQAGEYDAQETVVFVLGPDSEYPVAAISGGVVTLLVFDHLGRLIGGFREDGALNWIVEYDAWGNFETLDLAGQPVTQAPLLTARGMGFRPFFGAPSLYAFDYRWYSPQLGAFLTPDPLRTPSRIARPYSYALGRPLEFSDYTGLAPSNAVQQMVGGYLGFSGYFLEMAPPDTEDLINVSNVLAENYSNPEFWKQLGAEAIPFNGASERWIEARESGEAVNLGAAKGEFVAEALGTVVTVFTGGATRAAKVTNRLSRGPNGKFSQPTKLGGVPPAEKRPIVKTVGEDADNGRCIGGSCGLDDPSCFTAGTLLAVSKEGGYRPIEAVEVGDRVPQLDGARCSAEPFETDLETCRVVRLEFENPYGYEDHLVVELMRSAEWLAANQAVEGEHVWLAFEEIKVDGPGLVTEVTSCPSFEPEPDAGCLVTGTFQHRNRDIMRLTFEDSDVVLEPTAVHPLWSVERDDWIRAKELEPGHVLKTDGGTIRVATVEWLEGAEQVYNLEVAGDHYYLVSEARVLSHNANGCFNKPWSQMTKAEIGKFQHVWKRANQRGLNLGNLKTNAVDGEKARQKLNAVITHIEDNAQVVQNSSNTVRGLPDTPTITAKWSNPRDGKTYWVTREAENGAVVSLGSK